MATPNDTLDVHTRIQLAKDWLQEHDNKDEKLVTAVRIFNVIPSSLSYSVTYATNRTPGGGKSDFNL